MRFHWLQILQPEPNTYCLKRTSSYWNTKKKIEKQTITQVYHLQGYNFIGQGPEMPWFKKPSDGVYWSDFASVGLNLRIPIFGFGTKQEK
jgi:hypothetical protein